MKSVFFRVGAAALVLAWVSVIPVAAQTTASGTLKETVVTASRNSQPLSAALAHTTVISRDEIEKSQATDLVSLLQHEAGLQRSQAGGIGNTSTLFLRGLPSLDTLILIDGVPQTKQDASGSVSLEHIMLDNVERVEIVRGNVSAIYGSGAIGGVIQIFSRSPSQKPSATLRLEVGPRGTAKVSANGSVSVGNTGIQVGTSRLTTDGFSAINNAQLSTANPDADGYQNVSSNVSLVHAIAPQHRIGVQVVQSEARTSYDSYSYSLSTDVHASTTRLNQATVYSDNTWGTWRSRLSFSEQSEKNLYASVGSYTSDDGVNTRVNVLSWVNTLPLGSEWLGTAGVEQQQQHVDTSTTYPGTITYDKNRNTEAVFVGLEGCIGSASLQLNLRNDKLADLRQDTAYLGVGYTLTDAWSVNASTSTAFNAPPLGYLYDPYAGNQSLKPELAQSNELGLQYAKGKQLLRATYFDTRIRDQLIYDFSTSLFANVSHSRNSGFELSYQGTVASTDLRASLTSQNPVDETTGETLARRAKTMASLGVSQSISALRLGGVLRYVGESRDTYTDPISTSTVTTQLRSYTVLDLTASYRYSPTVALTARLDNVSDESYQTVYGYNQQPRSLYAGITWTPKR